jgi:hypothetical protein
MHHEISEQANTVIGAYVHDRPWTFGVNGTYERGSCPNLYLK